MFIFLSDYQHSNNNTFMKKREMSCYILVFQEKPRLREATHTVFSQVRSDVEHDRSRTRGYKTVRNKIA